MLRSVTTLLVASLAVTAAACADSPRLSPVGPSFLPTAVNSSSWSATVGAAAASNSRLGMQAQHVGGEGTVASLKGVCPDLTLVVRGVRVVTTADTVFENGACGNLRPGTRVAVEGDVGPNGRVVATSIRVTDQPGGTPVEGIGTVGSRHGACPTLTLVVHGYPVMTTEATAFSGGVCADVAPGRTVRVAGALVAHSVLATEVELLP